MNTLDKEARNRLELFINDAWNRGANWAMKGLGYAMDTNAEREIEVAIELLKEEKQRSYNEGVREARQADRDKIERLKKHCFTCDNDDEEVNPCEDSAKDNLEYNQALADVLNLLGGVKQ